MGWKGGHRSSANNCYGLPISQLRRNSEPFLGLAGLKVLVFLGPWSWRRGSGGRGSGVSASGSPSLDAMRPPVCQQAAVSVSRLSEPGRLAWPPSMAP